MSPYGSTFRLLPFIIILTALGVCSAKDIKSTTKFTNIKCFAFDKKFADFSHCYLSVPERGKIALNLYVKIYKLPITNTSVNLSLWKKVNGYRPFLYNYTTDFCKFLAHPPRISFLRIFYDVLQEDSNINHTCPYNHDVIVKNLILREEYFRLLPLPPGDYMFNFKVAAFNDWKADVKAYMSIILNGA